MDAGDAGDGGTDCPECGGRLSAGAACCPHCGTGLEGSAVDLSELDGLHDGREVADLVEVGPDGLRASGPVRLLAGLAVSVPLAPLSLFLVRSVVALSAPESVAVFVAGWLVPAIYLVRAPVPVAALGRSLTLVAVGTALIPVALRYGSRAPTAPGLGLGAITVVCLLLAAGFLALGAFVARGARGGVENPPLDGLDER